jgi:membrane-associated protease RseP (regulator of RpoE activity)
MNMKHNPFHILTAGIAAALIPSASAIEAPADDAPPPPMVEQGPAPDLAKPEDKLEIQPRAMAESAYLGVVSAAIPELLTEHLGLKPGGGILVQAVMPDGPAAKAGIAARDIITRINDQPVASPEDLSAKVKERKPGDKLRVDLIHQGKASTVDVTLGARPAEIAGVHPGQLDQLNLNGIPQDLADRLRGMIEGNVGGMELQPGAEPGFEAPPQMEDAMRQMKERMEKAMQGLNVPEIKMKGNIDAHQQATIRLMDEQGSIELKSSEGSKEVTIRDKQNNITWTGPWDTEQDKAAAPDDVRKRVERLNLDTKFKGNGLRLKLPGADAEDEQIK